MPPSSPADTLPRLGRRRAQSSEPFPLDRRDRRRLPFARELGMPATLTGVAAATVVGAILRLIVSRGLSLDEIRTVDAARLSLGALIHHLAHGGTTPPLHPVLEWLFMRLFGGGDFAMRAPSLIAGIALVPVVAWLARDLFDRRTAIVAALLAALAPALVWYSQEASGYALVALFGTLTVLGAARTARRGRPQDLALFTVAAALTVWSDWSGLFVLLATEIVVAVAITRLDDPTARRRRLRDWAIATLALVCQLAPLAVLAVSELRYGGGLAGVTGVGASGVSFYSGVSNVSWALFGFQPGTVTSVLSAVWPLAMLGSLVMVGRGIDRASALLRVCALIPVVGVFVLGVVAAGSFDVRYFLAAVAPVVVLLARDATHWPRSNTGRVLSVAVIATLFAGALLDQQVNRNNPRRFDYAPAFAAAAAEHVHGSRVYLLPGNLAIAAAHFAPGLPVHPLTRQLPTRHQARGITLITSSFAGQSGDTAALNRAVGALRATRHLVSRRAYPGISIAYYR